MPHSLNEQINIILSEFDFVKVQKVMKALNWKWQKYSEPDKFKGYHPTLIDLTQSARSLLHQCCGELLTKHEYVVSCGGFEAYRAGYTLSLKFIVEEQDTHYEQYI